MVCTWLLYMLYNYIMLYSIVYHHESLKILKFPMIHQLILGVSLLQLGVATQLQGLIPHRSSSAFPMNMAVSEPLQLGGY